MKSRFATLFAIIATAGTAAASEGLYYIGSEAQDSMPLKWVVGADLGYDDNVTPGYGKYDGDESFSISPYVGTSFVHMTPQTTWDVYARVGLIYYFDEPEAAGADDTYTQARAGVNVTHRFNDRLRLSSRNFISYELEPDYSFGYASTRNQGEYLYWQTDNALGYRWTERFATYTGFTLTGLDYSDSDISDRDTWALYNQFRYSLSQQTVLTAQYRYADTSASGFASDSNSHYITGGIEHRFSPTAVIVADLGAQMYDPDKGESNWSPYAQVTLRNQVNEQLMVRAFARYGFEVYDTTQLLTGPTWAGYYDFDQRAVLRVGLSGEYAITPMFTVFSGLDLIYAEMQDGRLVSTGYGLPPTAGAGDQDQTLLNLYVGVSVKFTDNLYGTCSYNFTNSNSDLPNQDYDRNRVSLGVRYEF
jgi:hypothetical protein